MKLSILDLAGDQAVLSGVQAGRQLLGKLVAAARPPAEPEPVYLDFDGVTVATASFLREGVIAFRDHVRATLPGLYPVIANASLAVTEELEFFLRHRRDAMWICNLTPTGEVHDPKKFWVNSTRRIARPSISSRAWVRQAHRVSQRRAKRAWRQRRGTTACPVWLLAVF